MCTANAFCAVAFDLHDALDTLPVDGTREREKARRRIAQQFTTHLVQAGLLSPYTGTKRCCYPLWDLAQYPDPRQRGGRMSRTFQPSDAWILQYCQRHGKQIPAGVRLPPRMAQAVVDLERTAQQLILQPQAIVLVLPYPPLANHRYATVQGRRVKTQAHRDYERSVGWAVKEQLPGHQPLTGSLALQVELHPRPLTRRRDKDKPITVIQDALKQAGVYVDDSQIDAPAAVLSTPSEPPYCVVTITASETR